jgi:hypothetical protein
VSPKAERRAARRRMVRDAHERWRSIRGYKRIRRLLAKCEEWVEMERAKMGPIERERYDRAHERTVNALIFGSGPTHALDLGGLEITTLWERLS